MFPSPSLLSKKGLLAGILLGLDAVILANASPLSMLSKRGKLEDLIGGSADLRIMPLGASITNGFGSSDGNGYRAHLRDLIVSDGGVDMARVDMVGSQHNGTMTDNDVEAYNGLRIDQVTAKAKTAVPRYKPNLVLINLGTNDAVQNFDVDTAGDRQRQLVEFVLENMSPGPVLLSTLLVTPNAATETAVEAINSQYRDLAQQLRGEGKPVVLVEMHDVEGLGVDALSDGIHPKDASYEVMANIWWDAILEAARAGFFGTPTETASASATRESRAGDSGNSPSTALTTTVGTTPTTRTATPTFTDSPNLATSVIEPDATSAVQRGDRDSGAGRMNNPVSHLFRGFR